MKAKNILIAIVMTVVLISIFYAFQGNIDQSGYIDEIQSEREERDRFMRSSKESPFADAPENFKGLNFYPADARYKIIADLTPIEDKKAITLTTNDGKEQQYLEYAYAEFDLDGYHHKLLVLEITDNGPSHGKLFFAFGDETSALETYGAGRYLDVLKVPGSQTITLDFNKAYNPYCAYTEKYSCPFPPPENLLKIPIQAGEKTYH